MADYDERPSWREIDKKRDGSSHVGRREGAKKEERPGNRWQQGRVKNALDRLFKGEKGTPEHDKLYNKVHGSYGSDRFLPTVERYVKKYGPPDDVPTLLLLFDARSADISALVIDALKGMAAGFTEREKADCRRKLSVVAMTDPSRDVRSAAGDAIVEMGIGEAG